MAAIEIKEEQIPGIISTRIVSANRAWTVSYRIGNSSIQSVQVFANDRNQAIDFARRIVGLVPFQAISVAEFNACSASVGTTVVRRTY